MPNRSPRNVWVDGRLLPAGGAHVSSFDRGLQLGDGIFETVRAHGGRPIELAAHVARLRRSAAGLDVDLPLDISTRLADGIATLLHAEHLDGAHTAASIRIIVTRGVWLTREVLPPLGETVAPTIVIQAWAVQPPTAAPPDEGLTVIHSEIRRDPANPLLDIKSISRAEYVYARLEARRAGADDIVFLTITDHLAEATNANIFLVRVAEDGATELATPALGCGVLPGTTRTWLLAWAAEVGIRPVEGWLTLADIAAADEVFLSSSVAGIRPVIRFDGRIVGAGHPGLWTRRARADREAFITGG